VFLSVCDEVYLSVSLSDKVCACVQGRLLYTSYTDVNSMLVVVNIDTLQPVDRISFSGQFIVLTYCFVFLNTGIVCCTVVECYKARDTCLSMASELVISK